MPSPDSNQSTDDFAQLMGDDVVRHTHDRADLHYKTENVNSRARRVAATEQQGRYNDELSDRLERLVESEEELIFAEPGVQQRLLLRMKKGHLPWEQGIDLHGYTVDQAREQLGRFIRDALRDNRRCVLVVHGKASNNEGRAALLKSYVNDWLRQIPQVLAFVSATTRDGGTGALYVLLKKKRPDPR